MLVMAASPGFLFVTPLFSGERAARQGLQTTMRAIPAGGEWSGGGLHPRCRAGAGAPADHGAGARSEDIERNARRASPVWRLDSAIVVRLPKSRPRRQAPL
jgi:hypothetical protein